MVSNQVPKKILDITEDCTRLVFDRLTLNQLIHLRAVCHPWNDIITDICEKKRKLLIFFSKCAVLNYCNKAGKLNVHNDPQFQITKRHLLLISSKLKGSTSQKALKRTRDGLFCEQQNDPNLRIRFVARLFPNITNFVCDINYERQIEMNYILWKWFANLHTLTIFLNYSKHNFISKDAQQDFAKCFEQMRSLKRLHLLLETHETFDLPNMATFGQLEEFTFDCLNINLAPYFAQLDANTCTLFRVINHRDSMDNSPNPIDTNRELASKLTHLSTEFKHPANPNHISRHVAEFKNLIQLEILHNQFNTMADVLKKTLPLKKLQILVLKVRSFFGRHEVEAYRNNPNYPNTFPIFHNTITELRLMDKDHRSYFPEIYDVQQYQLFARIFPMLRIIRIYSNNLNETDFDAQIRPRFNDAFGQRVEVKFYQTNKISISGLYS